MDFEKIIVITKKTSLEELIERFNTKDQAKFYIEHMGGSFHEYEYDHNKYIHGIEHLKKSLPGTLPAHFIERSFLPSFTFGNNDLVIAVGPDGLVVNTAKYLTGQKLLAFNPDYSRIDGILLPFYIEWPEEVISNVLKGKFNVRRISMAQVLLNDGQSLLALNDFFIGHKSHVSARYRISCNKKSENQISSGVIVSTGAGSTGWLCSIVTGAECIMKAFSPKEKFTPIKGKYKIDLEVEYLYFAVREPFPSKISYSELVFGKIEKDQELEVISHMPQNGVIFSDGIETDYLQFNSGSIAKVKLADRKLHLITSVNE